MASARSTCRCIVASQKRRQNWMKQADVLFAKFVKERDQLCLNCGSVDYLQCAHLITRAYKSIRVNPKNAVALCRRCHIFYTHRPLEWDLWVEEHFPGRLAELRQLALKYERVDWRAEVAAFKERI